MLAVQLLIIAIAPSRSNPSGDAALDTDRGGIFSPGGNGNGGAEAGSGDLSTGSTIAGGGSTGGTVAGGAATDGGGGGGGATAATGDTKHCVNGKQFSAAIYPWAPPCVAKFDGDNGGATYRGVTPNEIKVVVMSGNYGAAVEAALQAAGGSTPEQAQAAVAANQDFINARFELYGRKVKMVWRKFRCGTGGEGPPEDQCLRNEARQIVAEENPFAVIWDNSVSSATYDEFSNLKVLNFGGYAFRESFNRSNRPYHWDLHMSGTQTAKVAATWWCKRMAGHKAQYAGERNASNDMRNTTRVLGVVSTDDPENKQTITEFANFLRQTCNASVAHTYFYSQNVQTAPAQRRQAIAAMRENPQATSVACFCDQVAPAFLYDEMELNNYYPEIVIPAMGSNDTDGPGHTFDHLFDPQRPADEYPVYENAFGLGQQPPNEPKGKDFAARVWQATGRAGDQEYDALSTVDYALMVAALFQATGPNLTPAALEANAARLGVLGDATNNIATPRRFDPGRGDYTWNDGIREIYWATKRKAPYDDAPGAWAPLRPGWFLDAPFPDGAFGPLPPKPRS
ncbi:MAG TPA: hypothetical protein VMZ22_09495 [Acidimicrobiales bacterium]|nr:hypothetical protein [Acidimicrobiales bacterium]